jgi:hypothetical protein
VDIYLHLGAVVRSYRSRIRLNLRRVLMELSLQFGYGMMEHCRSLIKDWRGGFAILSPRDLTGTQLQRLGDEVNRLPGGTVLVDPQFYLPHADHERLRSHDYWPTDYQTNSFWRGPALTRLLTRLSELNSSIGSRATILPGLLAREVNDDWLAIQAAIVDEANQTISGHKIVTVALSAEALQSQDQVTRLLEESEKWVADSYYLVLEHPQGQYLVDNPNWLANVLDITAGLRLRGIDVILGYCNQQMLIAGCCKVNAIASGTWMNVRSFPPDKFRSTYEEEIKQRAIWYYCPQTLSEYKVPFLDIAHRQGILSSMKPPDDFDDSHVRSLFASIQPSSVGLSEQNAFRHYLMAMQTQTRSLVTDSFDETVERYETLLNIADSLLKKLRAAGVSGQHRDFVEIVDVNRAALEVLKTTHGPMLRRKWSAI